MDSNFASSRTPVTNDRRSITYIEVCMFTSIQSLAPLQNGTCLVYILSSLSIVIKYNYTEHLFNTSSNCDNHHWFSHLKKKTYQQKNYSRNHNHTVSNVAPQSTKTSKCFKLRISFARSLSTFSGSPFTTSSGDVPSEGKKVTLTLVGSMVGAGVPVEEARKKRSLLLPKYDPS